MAVYHNSSNKFKIFSLLHTTTEYRMTKKDGIYAIHRNSSNDL